MATSVKRDTKPIVVRKMPVIINSNSKVNNKSISDAELQSLLYKQDIIYEGNGDFLKEKYTKVVLYNRSHRWQNTSRTLVKCCIKDTFIEKTSDNVSSLIGQSNYDTVFSALCSVLSQDLRLKGILALLTPVKQNNNASIQTDLETNRGEKAYCDASTQTYIERRQKPLRKQIKPYIVKHDDVGKVKRLIITPEKCYYKVETNCKSEKVDVSNNLNNIEEPANVIEIKEELNITNTTIAENTENTRTIKEEHLEHEENSVDSFSGLSVCSVTTNSSVFNDLSLLNNVERHTDQVNEGFAMNIGEYSIVLKTKPEDEFHIATKENLMYLNPMERQKLLWYQAEIDLKNCLIEDEDGNLPLHIAVLNNDIELLKRHCAMLKLRKEHVDIPAPENYTALKMSIIKDFTSCMNILLRMGADPLQVDDDHRTPLHYAAEGSKSTVEALLKYCADNARRILQENDDIWKPNYETESDEQLSKYLLEYMGSRCDNQGYTPVMLASQLGNIENLKLLISCSPNTVNQRMPTSGNTALYLTIVAACTDALDRGNKTKLADKYQKTIELLLENGADPSIDNYAGSSVDLLLQELNISELSLMISRKITSLRFFEGKDSVAEFDSIMLVKSETGHVNVTELSSNRKIPRPGFTSVINNGVNTNRTIDSRVVKSNNKNLIIDHSPNSNTQNKPRSSKIKIIESIPVNIASNTIQKMTNNKLKLVSIIDKDQARNSNVISLDSIKTSSVKIGNSEEIKIVNTIDNINTTVPTSNFQLEVQTSNTKGIDKTKPKIISNTKVPSNPKKIILLNEIPGSSKNKPMFATSILKRKAPSVDKKPDYADKFKSFINNDEKGESNKRKLKVIYKRGAKVKKVENE